MGALLLLANLAWALLILGLIIVVAMAGRQGSRVRAVRWLAARAVRLLERTAGADVTGHGRGKRASLPRVEEATAPEGVPQEPASPQDRGSANVGSSPTPQRGANQQPLKPPNETPYIAPSL